MDFIQKIKNNAIIYEDGKWYICKQVSSTIKLKEDPDSSSQWHNNIVETSQTKLVKGDLIPENYANEEWFQLKAIQTNPSNIQHFKSIASDAVWQKMLDKDGKNIEYLNPQKTEYQDYAKKINPEYIQYFNPLGESDAIALLSLPNLHIKVELGHWNIYKETKKLCTLPLGNYFNKDFFYKKAFEESNFKKENAIAIVEKATREQEPRAIDFVLKHCDKEEFADGIIALAKQKNEEARKVVFRDFMNQKKFALYITKLIEEKDPYAVRFIFENEDSFKETIAAFALDGNEWAQNIVFSQPCDPKYVPYIKKLIKNNNQAAQTKAFQYIDLYWNCILDMAYNHNRKAGLTVLNHPDKPGYNDFIKNVYFNTNGFDPDIVKEADKVIEEQFDDVSDDEIVPENLEGVNPPPKKSDQNQSENQGEQVKPVDFAKEHEIKTDTVMQLLRDAGVKVLAQVSKLSASEYAKIMGKVEEEKQKARKQSLAGNRQASPQRGSIATKTLNDGVKVTLKKRNTKS